MKYKDTLFYKIVRPPVGFLVKFLFRPTVVGLENVPENGRVVLAGNHTKWLDPVLLEFVTKRQVHFLAKKELFDNKLTGWILRGFGCVPVDRKNHSTNSLEHANKFLESECCIGIFPEGTINRTDKVIMPFKKGAVKMSQHTNAPIVPFGITGKYKLFKKNSIRYEFFKLIKCGDDLDKANEKLEKIVSKCLIKNKEK